MSSTDTPASSNAARMAPAAPAPSGCGLDRWYASLLSPAPASRTSASTSGSSSANPAASPIDIPPRSIAQGRQGSRDSNSREPNPNKEDIPTEPTPPPPTTPQSPPRPPPLPPSPH